MRARPRSLVGLGIGAVLAGCALGPNYERPAVDVPAAYRGASAGPSAVASPQSLGNEKWWDVFADPVLQQLIRTALRSNYDVRIAVTRVLQAQAQLTITRANELPTLSAGGEALSERNPKVSSLFPAYTVRGFGLDLAVIWNLDFWGKYRRETEAARASLLASDWGRRAVVTSVVSEVATAYFQLRELDAALDVSQSTLTSRQSSLHLTQILAQHGSASALDVRQSQELVYTAAETIPDLERQIAQTEDALSTLLGRNPGPIPRGRALTEQPNPPSVPAGLPSELLERRPDIREAEDNLIAANAQIGVAKAALFPSISLTGTAGYESYALDRLFTTEAQAWDGTASITQPIFAGGSLRAGLRLAKAQQQQMLLTYRQAIVNAFQQVSDALVAYRKNREFREQQQRLTAATSDADRLSKVLYQHGGASYLQVLTSETNYFAAELNLAQAELNERLALVQLYEALGGGWSP
ncbi:MAG TPA: efflux transporter outer membrane subunit [Steroidobacteraceae bacterium]|nr:efflux transporter outer membrane subunit [Steroidobacteraceae bacterium]